MSRNEKLKIVLDTREQRPWTFSTNVDVVRKTLRTGDVSVDGLEDRVTIERKSLGDFVNTVIADWLRFRKQLFRMAGMDMACIVVECNLEQIVNKEYESDANPLSVLGRAHACYADHGVPVFYWGSPRLAADNAERFLLLAWRKLANGEP